MNKQARLVSLDQCRKIREKGAKGLASGHSVHVNHWPVRAQGPVLEQYPKGSRVLFSRLMRSEIIEQVPGTKFLPPQ